MPNQLFLFVMTDNGPKVIRVAIKSLLHVTSKLAAKMGYKASDFTQMRFTPTLCSSCAKNRAKIKVKNKSLLHLGDVIQGKCPAFLENGVLILPLAVTEMSSHQLKMPPFSVDKTVQDLILTSKKYHIMGPKVKFIISIASTEAYKYDRMKNTDDIETTPFFIYNSSTIVKSKNKKSR